MQSGFSVVDLPQGAHVLKVCVTSDTYRASLCDSFNVRVEHWDLGQRVLDRPLC
jgi:hypothetical protein